MNGLYYGLMMFVSLLFAGNFVAGKFLVGHTSALTLTDLRWGISILLLIPIVYVQDKRILPPKNALLPLFLMGLTGVVFFNLFMYWALERTSADNVGLLSALNPVSIAIASFLITREKMTGRQVIAMGISCMGVLLVISRGYLSEIIHFHFNIGDLWMLGAVGMWGLYSVSAKYAMNYVSPLMSTLYAGVFGTICLLPFDVHTFWMHAPDRSFWLAVVYVSIGATVIAMALWNIGVQRLGGTKAGMFLNFNPIFTALLAFWLINEKVTVIQLLGTALVIVGIYLFTLKKSATTRRKMEEGVHST